MNIVKHETVVLSETEKKAFDLVGRVLENISKKADDPELAKNALGLSQRFDDFYAYYTEEDIE